MPNVGEEIAGQYLKYCKGCEFIDYNVYTIDSVGEIDVVGINSKEKCVYLCEVAIHSRSGLRYTKNKRPDNVNRFMDKFSKDIEYAKKSFEGYNITVMLWSPIVKSAKKESIYDQMKDVELIKQKIFTKYHINIVPIINEDYYNALLELRKKASTATEELKSPVMRYLQIEEKLKSHIININNKISK